MKFISGTISRLCFSCTAISRPLMRRTFPAGYEVQLLALAAEPFLSADIGRR